MATSTEKTILLILLAVIIFFLVIRMTPLILAPFGVFMPGFFHFFKDWDFGHFGFSPASFVKFSTSLFSLALLILWIFVIIWVYRDAERRGMNGILWALLVFIGNLIGLLIYLIVRSGNLPREQIVQKTVKCPSCQKEVAETHLFCPHCGNRLRSVCPKCQKPVEKDWQVCPHCGEKLS